MRLPARRFRFGGSCLADSPAVVARVSVPSVDGGRQIRYAGRGALR